VNRGQENDRHRPSRALIALAAAVAAVLVLPAAPAAAEEQVTVASVDVNGQDVQVVRVTVPVSQADTAAEELTAQTGNPAAIDAPLKLIEANNDTYRSQQWALDRVTFEDAQSLSTGSGVTVAVVDTGVQPNHPDLAGQVLTGWNIIKGTTASADDNGHGTHVAGIIAAIANNSAGITGGAPGVKILPVKVLDSSGSGTWADVAAGILWACNNGAKVINLSVGGTSGNQTLADAVAQANASGCLLVAAAGNLGNTTNLPSYPGAYPEPIAVASVDSNLGHSYFSNTGTYVDIAAPGSSIYSTLMGSSYAYMSGTSMATPYAAAEAALIWSANSSWTSTQVRDRLLTTATDLGTSGYDTTFGAGLINPSTAVCGHMCLAPTITAVGPTSGTTLGGTSVTIAGTSFNGATAVTFGGSAAASYTVNSATQITATAPPRAAGAVDVSVATTGGTAISTNAFTYTAPDPAVAPTLTLVTPATGSSLGGTVVTLTGANLTGATAVSFGGTPAASFALTSATSITATTPAAAAGAVSVSVTTPGGTSSLPTAFTYVVPVPTITSVSPTSGTTAGGSIVAITGTNLTGTTAVTFGTAPATAFTVTSATSITATTPAAAAGAVSVSVTTPGGTRTQNGAFTFVVPTPTITSVSPSSGTTAGGTTVTISGTNLTGATAVSFGGTAPTSYSVGSATSITAYSPATAVGVVYVSVTTPGGTTQLASAFTFTAPVSSGGAGGASGGGASGGGGGGGDPVAAPAPAAPAVPSAVVEPTVEVSIATVTPATPAPISFGGGLTLLQPGDTAAEHPVVVRKAASRLSSSAHVALSKVGQPSQFVITGLPRNTVLRVQLGVAGRYALIGRLRTDATGRLSIPVLVSSNAGPHPLRMTTPKGAAYYLRIDFRR
jgi:hypothetical protein